jgi:choice-of-anchor C domain-containing protein
VNPGSSTTLFAEDSTTIEGWTVQNGSVDYCENRWMAAEGNRCIDLTGVSAGTLVQTIDGFIVGRTYRLSFLIAANTEGGPATKSLSVEIGAISRIFEFDGTGYSGSNMGWKLRTLDFTATNSTLTLAFAGMQSGLYGAVLDSVSIGDVPLELSIRSSQVEVCWPSLTNFTYQIQYRSTLTTNRWVNLVPPMAGNGSNSCVLDIIAPEMPRRFYQVIRL